MCWPCIFIQIRNCSDWPMNYPCVESSDSPGHLCCSAASVHTDLSEAILVTGCQGQLTRVRSPLCVCLGRAVMRLTYTCPARLRLVGVCPGDSTPWHSFHPGLRPHHLPGGQRPLPEIRGRQGQGACTGSRALLPSHFELSAA